MSHSAKKRHRQTAATGTGQRNTTGAAGGYTFAVYVGEKNVLTFLFAYGIFLVSDRQAANTTTANTTGGQPHNAEKHHRQKGKKDHERKHEHNEHHHRNHL